MILAMISKSNRIDILGYLFAKGLNIEINEIQRLMPLGIAIFDYCVFPSRV